MLQVITPLQGRGDTITHGFGSIVGFTQHNIIALGPRRYGNFIKAAGKKNSIILKRNKGSGHLERDPSQSFGAV